MSIAAVEVSGLPGVSRAWGLAPEDDAGTRHEGARP